MRVVLLSYYYPPDRAVGGQRARNVAEALRAAGHDVTVIAAGESGSAHESATRVKPLPSIRTLYALVKTRIRSLQQPTEFCVENPTRGSKYEISKVSRLKRWIFSLIWLPDDHQGYVLPAVYRAMRYPGGRPELIYSTAPPFSVHLAGLLLKGLTGSRWVADFRDPWTGNPWKQDYLRSQFSDFVERYLEKLCLEKADLIIPVSDGIADRIRKRVPEGNVVTVRNGIARLEKADRSTGQERSGPFRIVHAGSFYHSRNPFPFLLAVKQLAKHEATEDEGILVQFIGSTEAFHGVFISDFIQYHGLQKLVRLEGWLDREACQKHLQSADALLLLAMQQPDQVPNKLYEYLGLRRPILAITDSEGETESMLRQAGGHVIVTANEVPLISAGIMELLDSKATEVGDQNLLVKWSTEKQMARLVAAVGKLEPNR